MLKNLFTLKVCENMINSVKILTFNVSARSINTLLSNIQQFEQVILCFVEEYKDLFWQYQLVFIITANLY